MFAVLSQWVDAALQVVGLHAAPRVEQAPWWPVVRQQLERVLRWCDTTTPMPPPCPMYNDLDAFMQHVQRVSSRCPKAEVACLQATLQAACTFAATLAVPTPADAMSPPMFRRAVSACSGPPLHGKRRRAKMYSSRSVGGDSNHSMEDGMTIASTASTQDRSVSVVSAQACSRDAFAELGIV